MKTIWVAVGLLFFTIGSVWSQQLNTLPSATIPLTGDELIYLVQQGVSKQTSASNVGGGSSGLTIGTTTITGCATSGFVLFNNGGKVGCESVAGTGTVTTISVASANGLAGSVVNPTTTPVLTLATTITGVLKGNGTAIGAASPGTDYLAPNGNGSGLTGLVYTQLPSLSANTVLGALTATTPSGLAMPSCSGATNALIWTSGSGFGCNTIAASSGTVTSIALTVPGIFTVTGSPITTSGTLGIVASGTSGGIPYFSSSIDLASSNLLTANALMLGGGAATAPGVLGSLGTTTTVLHGNAAGAPTFGAVSLTTDVSGTLPVVNGGTGAASLLANAILVGNGTSPISDDGAGSTLTTGILSVLGLTGSSSAPFRISTNNAANQMLFKFGGQSGSNTLIMSSTQLLPQKTTIMGFPNSSISGRSFDTTTDSTIFLNSTLTGAITGTTSPTPFFGQVTWGATVNAKLAVWNLNSIDTVATNANIYTVDAAANCGALPTVPYVKECHSARFTTIMNNQGGTIGSPNGYAIGSKSSVSIPLGGGNNYMALGLGLQVLATNLDTTTQDLAGISIVAGTSAVGSTRNNAGILFNAFYGGNGQFTKHLIDLAGSGLGAPLATGGTAIGASGTMTIARGIDFRTLTITGNAYDDGHATIDGPTGNIVTTGTISGTGSGLTSLNASQLTSGTVAAARGGAGTINGVLAGNGSGVVSQGAASGLSNGTTGSGAVVLATSPTLVTPALGTPSSGVGTNLTGIPTSALTGTMTDPVCATWDSTTAVTAQTITFPAAWATYTITSVKAKVSGGGSFTYAMQIGGTPVTSCNGVTVNSASNVNTSCTAANTGVVNDIISMVIASPSGTVNTAYVCPVFTHSVN